MSMDNTHDSSLDQLIETYRQLNATVRNTDNADVREIVRQMRQDELLFAVALKERLLGSPSAVGVESPIVGLENESDSLTMLVSQFGTARATTLTTVKALTGDQWSIDTGDGRTIRNRVDELAENDKRQLAAIRGHLGS